MRIALKPPKLKDPVDLFVACRGTCSLRIPEPEFGAARLDLVCDEPKYSERVAWQILDLIPNALRAGFYPVSDLKIDPTAIWVVGPTSQVCAKALTEAIKAVLGGEFPISAVSIFFKR